MLGQSLQSITAVRPAPRRVSFISYVNPDRLPPLINSTRLIAETGVDVDVLSIDNGERWSVRYGRVVHNIRFRTPVDWIPWSPPRAALRLVLFTVRCLVRIGVRRYPLMVANDPQSLIVAHVARLLRGGDVAYHCHELVLLSETSGFVRVLKLIEQRLLRRTRILIVPEQSRGRLMSEARGVDKPLYVVANCPLLAPRQRTHVLPRRLAGLGFRFSRIVLRQGVIGPGHSIEATIRGLPQWVDTTWGLVILGYAVPGFVDTMRNLAAEVGVADRVVFLPAVSYDEVLDHTRSADLGLALYSPTNANHRYSGTASNKLFEYLSAGLPIVASDSPIMHDLVLGNGVGRLADPDNPASIANAVNQLLIDPHAYEGFADRAYSLFASRFHYEAQYAPVLTEIRAILERPDRFRSKMSRVAC